MEQLKSLERRLHKDDTLRKHYQETIHTDVKACYIRNVKQVEPNETRDKLHWSLPHKPHKPKKNLEEYATQQQRTKVQPLMTNFYVDQTCCSF